MPRTSARIPAIQVHDATTTAGGHQQIRELTVVNVVAASYCGSTWMNLLIGSHPEAFSVGEIDKILSTGRPLCTLHGDDCPLWSQYDLDGTESPYTQIARLSGKRWLVVNNARRLLPAQQDPRIRSFYVWLVRDGRAAVAGRLRKYGHEGVWAASRSWVRQVRKKRRLIRQQPPGQAMTLHYEVVQANSLRRICRLIGLEFTESMMA
jgi:hypothetical protein